MNGPTNTINTTEYHFPSHYVPTPIPYVAPNIYHGADRWQCPDCKHWIAWWVAEHKCQSYSYSTTSNRIHFQKDSSDG